MALKMLATYYSKNSDSRDIFDELSISADKYYLEYLNKYNVIFLNILDYISKSKTKLMDEMISNIKKDILREFELEYPEITNTTEEDIFQIINTIYSITEISFIILRDEWDCIFREFKDSLEE